MMIPLPSNLSNKCCTSSYPAGAEDWILGNKEIISNNSAGFAQGPVASAITLLFILSKPRSHKSVGMKMAIKSFIISNLLALLSLPG
jgi:hypothetical protein